MADDYFQTVRSLPLQQYLMHDWTPATGMTLEEWAQDLWDHGWRDWFGPGNWVTIDGERRFRVSLRREAHYLKDELREQRAAERARTSSSSLSPRPDDQPEEPSDQDGHSQER